MFDSNNVNCDIILGIEFLSKVGIKLNHSKGTIEWLDCSIPLHPVGSLVSKEFDAMENMFHIQVKDELLGEYWLKFFATATVIMDAKYE